MAVIFFLHYLFLYAFLSMSGKYEGDVVIHDEIYGPCLCIVEDEYWQPSFIVFARYDGELLANSYGYLFFPLIMLDQRFWHPTRNFMENLHSVRPGPQETVRDSGSAYTPADEPKR